MGYFEYVNRYNAQVHGILPPSAVVVDILEGSGGSDDGEGSNMEISDDEAECDRDKVSKHTCLLPESAILSSFRAPCPPMLSYHFWTHDVTSLP